MLALQHILGDFVRRHVLVPPETRELRADAAPRLTAEYIGEAGGALARGAGAPPQPPRARAPRRPRGKLRPHAPHAEKHPPTQLEPSAQTEQPEENPPPPP